ncbi:hypothetical protein KFE94_03290 [bacterium SCSIO 12643]|nr:hypothetical protein KFE94_03290 [bacterium SCSIO 12643]
MEVKNVCFVANYGKSQLFDQVAKQLTDCNIYWITVNQLLYDQLILDYPKSSVLFIDKFSILSKKEDKGNIGKYKINELFLGDRVLKYEKWAVEYLSILSQEYYSFFEGNSIDFVFGEQTWAHEILAHRVLSLNKELKGKFLSPHTVRIPGGRFAFFEDEFQSSILESQNPELNEKNMSVLKAKKPSYLALNDTLLDEKSKISYFVKKAKYFFSERIYESHDPTKPDSLKRAMFGFLSYYVNKKKYHWFIKEQREEDVLKKDFVLFTLHKQPEASIDNTGRYFENQFEIIKNIWRILPQDTFLIVKEHTNAIGDRNLDFYYRIQALKNVEFVEYRADSYSLIDKAKAVFTISGTIAYEAALMKTPAFTFIPIFFNRLSMCRHIDFTLLRDPKNNLQSLIDSVEYKEEVDLEYSNWIKKNSYSGIISDPISDPRCMEDINIKKVSEAFLNTIGLK